MQSKHYMGLRLAQQYDDLVTLLRFANLPLDYTDVTVLLPPIGKFAYKELVPTRIKTTRKRWRWPHPLDERERARTLTTLSGRLRRRFPPLRKDAVATLRLRAATYHITDVDKAFEIAGSIISVLTTLALRNHVGQPPGDVSIVPRYNLPIEIRVRPDHIIEPAPDVLETCLRRALVGCDARRIRECPVCGRLFIAKRHDQIACEKRCANLVRVQRFRSPNKLKEYREHHQRNLFAKERRENKSR